MWFQIIKGDNMANSSKKTLKKSTITKKKCTNSPTVADWRTHYEFWSGRELSLGSLERLAENIITLVKEDKTILSWNKVLLLCDIHPTDFKVYQKRCPELTKSKRFAMFALGVNREEKAITRQIDYNVMKHMQGLYDKSWAAQEERHAELRKNISSENTTKIIVMKDFEEKPKNNE